MNADCVSLTLSQSQAVRWQWRIPQLLRLLDCCRLGETCSSMFQSGVQASDRLKRSVRATLLGLVVNTALTTAKFVAGVLGHSHALVADAVESLADIFSSLIVWRGLVVAAEPADEDHTYGHGKAEPLAAAVVAGMLLDASGWVVVRCGGNLTGSRVGEGVD